MLKDLRRLKIKDDKLDPNFADNELSTKQLIIFFVCLALLIGAFWLGFSVKECDFELKEDCNEVCSEHQTTAIGFRFNNSNCVCSDGSEVSLE